MCCPLIWHSCGLWMCGSAGLFSMFCARWQSLKRLLFWNVCCFCIVVIKTICSVLSPTVCNWYRCCEAVYFQAVQNGLWFLENSDITPHLLEYCELVMQWQCTCLSCRWLGEIGFALLIKINNMLARFWKVVGYYLTLSVVFPKMCIFNICCLNLKFLSYDKHVKCYFL